MVELDPQAKALLQRMALSATSPPPTFKDDAEWAAAGRKMHRGIVALSGAPEDVEHIEDQTIPGPNGAIPIRLYRPTGCKGQGAFVYLHGGGFVSGDLETHAAPLRALANRSRQTVIAVDYRLAPEHQYPIGLEDCVAAATWTDAHAAELHIDPKRISVGGDSSGGALAVGVALSAHGRGTLKFSKLILIYPNADLCDDRVYPSIDERAPRPSWRADMERYFRAYVPADTDRRSGLLSPVYATYAVDFPSTFIALAEADPLFDEGQRLAAVMTQAGVKVTTQIYRGMIHGFFQMAGVLDAGRQLVDDIGANLAAP